MSKYDVVVVGAGHNGLCCAIKLAKVNLRVLVLEQYSEIGGACRTSYPFRSAPEVGTSPGAYLLGLMPPVIIEEFGLKLKLRRRNPHYFLPTREAGRYLVMGSDSEATKNSFLKFSSEADWRAYVNMQSHISRIAKAVLPSWLSGPKSIELIAEDSFTLDSERKDFVSLCKGSVMKYINRWGFKSDLIKVMFALDGLIGSTGGLNSEGTGFNFLIHNMCHLPGADGTWMLVEGGMGAVTQELFRIAKGLGVEIVTNSRVKSLTFQGTQVKGVALENGKEHSANCVVLNSDPKTIDTLLGDEVNLPNDLLIKFWRFSQKLGTSMKINLCLEKLPTLTCCPDTDLPFIGTCHILPPEEELYQSMQNAFDRAKMRQLPDFPIIEWYTQTVLDPSLQGGTNFHNAALFVQGVPNSFISGTWDDHRDEFVDHLLSKVEEFAPGLRSLVREHHTLTPLDIERTFGIRGGHILHVDHYFMANNRLPYYSGIDGLYFCGAGCHPGGGVSGIPGYNSASQIIKDLNT